MADPQTSQRPRRSVLYMPGANERALEKAKTLETDALILDLEDAVAPDAKSQARERVCAAATSGEYGDREITIINLFTGGLTLLVCLRLALGAAALAIVGTLPRNVSGKVLKLELAKRFATYDAGVSAILQNMQRLTIAKQAARAINVEAEPLLNDTVKLSQVYEGGAGFARTFTLWAAIVFAILANREYRVLKHNLDIYRQRFDAATDKPYPHMDLGGPALGFVELAAGMGVPGVRVDKPDDLAGALAAAFAAGGPRIVEIAIEGKR